VLLPLAALPDLALGGLGRLEPARYPSDWAAVASQIPRDGGEVLALPAMAFRQFAWNQHRTQLDPAPWLLPAPTITDDTLVVDGLVIAGEDERAARVRAAAESGPEQLTALGIEWVIIEHGTPGRLPAWLDGLPPRFRGEWVSLYRVGDPAQLERTGPPVLPVVAADVLALCLAAGAMLWLLLPMGTVVAKLTSERVR
jgi:hypothetical protein